MICFALFIIARTTKSDNTPLLIAGHHRKGKDFAVHVDARRHCREEKSMKLKGGLKWGAFPYPRSVSTHLHLLVLRGRGGPLLFLFFYLTLFIYMHNIVIRPSIEWSLPSLDNVKG